MYMFGNLVNFFVLSAVYVCSNKLMRILLIVRVSDADDRATKRARPLFLSSQDVDGDNNLACVLILEEIDRMCVRVRV